MEQHLNVINVYDDTSSSNCVSTTYSYPSISYCLLSPTSRKGKLRSIFNYIVHLVINVIIFVFSHLDIFVNIIKRLCNINIIARSIRLKTTEQKKKERDSFKNGKILEISNLLVKSKAGMTAVEVSEKIKVKDVRFVRELIRKSLDIAKNKKQKTTRERMQGKATKIYNIFLSTNNEVKK